MFGLGENAYRSRLVDGARPVEEKVNPLLGDLAGAPKHPSTDG